MGFASMEHRLWAILPCWAMHRLRRHLTTVERVAGGQRRRHEPAAARADGLTRRPRQHPTCGGCLRGALPAGWGGGRPLSSAAKRADRAGRQAAAERGPRGGPHSPPGRASGGFLRGNPAARKNHGCLANHPQVFKSSAAFSCPYPLIVTQIRVSFASVRIFSLSRGGGSWRGWPRMRLEGGEEEPVKSPSGTDRAQPERKVGGIKGSPSCAGGRNH